MKVLTFYCNQVRFSFWETILAKINQIGIIQLMPTLREQFRSLVAKCNGEFVCQKNPEIKVATDDKQALALLDYPCLEAAKECGGCVGMECPIEQLWTLANQALGELNREREESEVED